MYFAYLTKHIKEQLRLIIQLNQTSRRIPTRQLTLKNLTKTKSVNLNLPNSWPTKALWGRCSISLCSHPSTCDPTTVPQNFIICIPTGSVYTILIKGFISEHQRISTMLRSLIRYPQYYCYFCLRLIYERPLLLAQRIVMSVFVRPPTLYYPFDGPARMPLFRLISLWCF